MPVVFLLRNPFAAWRVAFERVHLGSAREGIRDSGHEGLCGAYPTEVVQLHKLGMDMLTHQKVRNSTVFLS